MQAKEKDQLNTEDYTKGMMESSMGIDMGLLDLDLLQLPDLPSSPSPSSSSTSPKHSLSHARLDDLFAQWLSLPDTQRLVELTAPPPPPFCLCLCLALFTQPMTRACFS